MLCQAVPFWQAPNSLLRRNTWVAQQLQMQLLFTFTEYTNPVQKLLN
jgi:hypothetical protein